MYKRLDEIEMFTFQKTPDNTNICKNIVAKVSIVHGQIIDYPVLVDAFVPVLQEKLFNVPSLESLPGCNSMPNTSKDHNKKVKTIFYSINSCSKTL